MYSYESEWSMGAEWWMRKGNKGKDKEALSPIGIVDSGETLLGKIGVIPSASRSTKLLPTDDIQGVVKARVSTNTVNHTSQIAERS